MRLKEECPISPTKENSPNVGPANLMEVAYQEPAHPYLQESLFVLYHKRKGKLNEYSVRCLPRAN